MAENLEPGTLVLLKDTNGFEIVLGGRKKTWKISQHKEVPELFDVEKKEDGKAAYEFVVFYSSLDVKNLYELYLNFLIDPEKMIRKLFGEYVKVDKIVVIRKDGADFGKDFERIDQRKIRINMWPSKTFLRNSCNEYVSQLNVQLLEKIKDSLAKVENVVKVYDWKHYCGAEPRYWDIEIKNDNSIEFKGGVVWKAVIKYNIMYTDGCVSKELLKRVIDEALGQAATLNCKRE